MDQGANEVNQLLPATIAVTALFILSLAAIGLSYLLKYKLIDVAVRPFATNLLRGLGLMGIGLVLVVLVTFVLLKSYAPN